MIKYFYTRDVKREFDSWRKRVDDEVVSSDYARDVQRAMFDCLGIIGQHGRGKCTRISEGDFFKALHGVGFENLSAVVPLSAAWSCQHMSRSGVYRAIERGKLAVDHNGIRRGCAFMDASSFYGFLRDDENIGVKAAERWKRQHPQWYTDQTG